MVAVEVVCKDLLLKAAGTVNLISMSNPREKVVTRKTVLEIISRVNAVL